ncbi:MAG: MerR family transcriptional regulator [Erysipelotrichaceae bacterium]|nr:MerR family transcriptional regulator [Erysipelotrichaceae bacterium]
MSRYTTGEIAKMCGVTVRTVQYYDTRGILVPSELSEGGRRLYSDDDLKKMRIICFLRDIGLKIDAISQILKEDDPDSLIRLLLDQQEMNLKQEIAERKEQLEKVSVLRSELDQLESVSAESIGDIAYIMSNRERLKKIHRNLILAALPVSVLEIAGIIVWIMTGNWHLFVLYVFVAVIWAVPFSMYYFNHVSYICPQCHTVFRPSLKEAVFANHTLTARKLTCPECGHHGFCVETAREEAVTHE